MSDLPEDEGSTTAEQRQWYLDITSRPPNIPTGCEWLNTDGALKASARPAAYMDSSALIDYWRTEEVGLPEMGRFAEGACRRLFQFLFDQGGRLTRMASAREAVLSKETELTLVASPLALIELQSWTAEMAMLDWLTQAAGPKNVKQRRHKNVGQLLRACWDARGTDCDEIRQAMELVELSSVIEPTWASAHGLAGIYIASLRQFSMGIDDFWGGLPWLMSYVQIGAADVLHVCIAKHLGCRYFVSFDADFKRIREEMDSEMGLELICTPQQLLDVTRRHTASSEPREH